MGFAGKPITHTIHKAAHEGFQRGILQAVEVLAATKPFELWPGVQRWKRGRAAVDAFSDGTAAVPPGAPSSLQIVVRRARFFCGMEKKR